MVRYLLVAVLARLPDEGARVALVLLALERTGSGALGGEMVGALLIPHVLAAPVIGTLADRTRHRRALHGGALAGFGAALVGCGLATGRVPAPLVLLLAAAGGCLAPMITGGLSSLLADLLPPDRLARGYALDAASYNVAGIAGPAVAGVLAALAGAPLTMVVLGCCALASATLLVTGLRMPRREGPAEQVGRSSFTAGIAAIVRSRPLAAVTAATALGAAGVGALPVTAALLARRYHSAAGAGLLIAVFAAGGLLGSLGYARRPLHRDRPERVVLLALAASAVPLALVPFAPGSAVALGLFAVAGLFVGPQVSALFAVREQHSPEGARTQVFTFAAGAKLSAAAVGAALAGRFAHAGPYPLILGVAGAHLLAALGGAAVLRRRAARQSTVDSGAAPVTCGEGARRPG